MLKPYCPIIRSMETGTHEEIGLNADFLRKTFLASLQRTTKCYKIACIRTKYHNHRTQRYS